MTTTRRPYTPLTTPISAADAEQEPAGARVFAEQPAPRAYAARLYTIDAISPLGFPVHLTFADLKLTDLAEHIAALAKLGYTPPTQAPAAAPLATGWQSLPDGTPICPKHQIPMRKRTKQGDEWYSHQVKDRNNNEVYCKGYKGKDSPGYDCE